MLVQRCWGKQIAGVLMRFLQVLGAALWPPRCYLCGCPLAWDEALCEDCLGRFEEAVVCYRCGARLASAEVACPQCSKVRPPWRGFLCAYRYEGDIKDILAAAKYYGETSALRALVALTTRFWQQHKAEVCVDLITWVPPDPVRLWQRGYDVVGELALAVGRVLAVDVKQTLRKRFSTPPQAGRSQAQRKAALSGAFQLTADVTGKRVLLVDDLATTCTTLRRCTRLLRRAGADVFCFTLAR